jgi:hypothetical protein
MIVRFTFRFSKPWRNIGSDSDHEPEKSQKEHCDSESRFDPRESEREKLIVYI